MYKDHVAKNNRLTVVYFITGKLLSKTQKIAYSLLNKVGQKGEVPIKPGDRVALVYPNNDPISFICGFYGCLMAAVVPVPVEVPTSRRVSVKKVLQLFTNTKKRMFTITPATLPPFTRTH